MANHEDNNREKVQTDLIFGDDELKVSRQAQKIVDSACPPEEQALGLEIVDGDCKDSGTAVEAVKECIEALRTVGFFGGGKTVWLRQANFLDTSPVAMSNDVKSILKILSDMIKTRLGDDCHLVISSPKVYKNSPLYKACKVAGAVHEYGRASKPKDREKEARNLAKQTFDAEEIKVGSRALETFVNRCGTDPRQIVQEVEKLSLYLQDRKELRMEDVALLTTPAAETAFWELGDAVAKRDAVAAIRLINRQAETGGSEIGMIMGIERRFEQLLVLRECLRNKIFSIVGSGRDRKVQWSKDPEQESLLDELFPDKRRDPRKFHPYRVLMLCQDAQNYSRSELRKGLKIIRETHETLVSRSIPSTSLLEMMIIKILQKN